MDRRGFMKALAAIGTVAVVPVRATTARVAAVAGFVGTWINIKWYGAKGDGLHDDGPAIRAAMDEAARTGRTVHFPRGRYRL